MEGVGLNAAPAAELQRLRQIVVLAAREELVPRFADIARRPKPDGSWVTEADTGMQARLARELQQAWPDYAFMGEEMSAAEQGAVLASDTRPTWCLDPLDGTTNFTNGVPFYAVSLALLAQGELRLGMVYDPLRDECFMAAQGQGAWLNDEVLKPLPPPLALRRCVGVVDFKRLTPRLASRLGQDPPYASQRSFGACALDWCWLAAGRFQVYLHGGQRLWDYAAGNLILTEAGGHSCTLDGDALFDGTLEPRSAVAALDPDLFRAWQAWIAIHR
ncbi:MAG TPA: inositol monophosphatase [Acidiferrobacteraceae bacterium]|nr:inositol monophosphatase [Acidiferrobacteraceae bacterium]